MRQTEGAVLRRIEEGWGMRGMGEWGCVNGDWVWRGLKGCGKKQRIGKRGGWLREPK